MHVFTNVDECTEDALTWYDKSGLISYRNNLYFTCDYDARSLGIAASIHAKAHVLYDRHGCIAVWFPEIEAVVTNDVRYSRLITNLPARYIISNPQIWTRAQRWLRAIIRQRLENRRLAIAMAWHHRLGEKSPLGVVTQDLARLFCKY